MVKEKITMDSEAKFIVTIITRILVGLIGVVVLSLGGCPVYRVWEQGLTGQAELARAEQNRHILVTQAIAEQEAAKSRAAAEVERAKGSALASAELIKTLGGPENYLRWLYINSLDDKDSAGHKTTQTTREVIYVPVIDGLPGMIPITEAGRLARPAQEKK